MTARTARECVCAQASFMRWVDATAPLWRMGKRKKPPKLPQRAVGNTRLLYARVTTYQADEVAAAAATADVIILNWGLHYQVMDQYRKDLSSAFEVLNAHAAQPGKAVLFSETGAQHFKASDARGYSTGEWENRDKSADTQCKCQPIEDFNVNVRNRVLREVAGGAAYPNIRTLPFYELTKPRWRWHFGNWCAPPQGSDPSHTPSFHPLTSPRPRVCAPPLCWTQHEAAQRVELPHVLRLHAFLLLARDVARPLAFGSARGHPGAGHQGVDATRPELVRACGLWLITCCKKKPAGAARCGGPHPQRAFSGTGLLSRYTT